MDKNHRPDKDQEGLSPLPTTNYTKVSGDSGLRGLFFGLSDLVLVFWQVGT